MGFYCCAEFRPAAEGSATGSGKLNSAGLGLSGGQGQLPNGQTAKARSGRRVQSLPEGHGRQKSYLLSRVVSVRTQNELNRLKAVEVARKRRL